MTNKFINEKNMNLKKDSKKISSTINDIKDSFESNVKEGFNKFAHVAEEAIHNAKDTAQTSCSNTKSLFENLSQNINNAFKHNLTMGQTCLQCKTATDFIDIQRKFFECNYKSMMKTYSDLMQDIQQMSKHTVKN